MIGRVIASPLVTARSLLTTIGEVSTTGGGGGGGGLDLTLPPPPPPPHADSPNAMHTASAIAPARGARELFLIDDFTEAAHAAPDARYFGIVAFPIQIGCG
jgi:hypothetical protein